MKNGIKLAYFAYYLDRLDTLSSKKEIGQYNRDMDEITYGSTQSLATGITVEAAHRSRPSAKQKEGIFKNSLIWHPVFTSAIS